MQIFSLRGSLRYLEGYFYTFVIVSIRVLGYVSKPQFISSSSKVL